jgi:Copper type II ascorbate-dependent monooxygenase, C-terminal domain
VKRRRIAIPATARVLFVSATIAMGLAACGSSPGHAAKAATTASASNPPVHTISLQSPTSYTPSAPAGATDDYHCTLVDPHVTTDSTIVSSQFFPESPEVHHAILFLVPPSLASQANLADDVGKGWTCFGESPLPGTSFAQVSNTPWLSAWAPGHGLDTVPAGTGVPFPAGSLVVMQIHYNLLVGDKPVRSKLVLHTVPATTNLTPLHLDLLPAPPDIPCPTGVTGPLCDRAASLADTGQRFGHDAIQFVNFLEQFCGRNVADPPGGDTTSCTWPAPTGTIVRLTAHMHLLGQGMTIVLDAGTPNAKTLLDVPNYNFDYQRSYNLATPVTTKSGDTIQVTCTYNPTLRQELPQLRKLPPRYVTWGDGSSDEMCLALVNYISTSNAPSL